MSPDNSDVELVSGIVFETPEDHHLIDVPEGHSIVLVIRDKSPKVILPPWHGSFWLASHPQQKPCYHPCVAFVVTNELAESSRNLPVDKVNAIIAEAEKRIALANGTATLQ